ncbi:MAG: glycerol-3-phosphate dehydrogenase [Alphaproteobacteria bacterium]|nr:MAG: glycerol-3-phosphate dehydrogenase [Alphaproteobacteria bacterium]
MKEGSLDAPTRHPLNWRDPDFYDPEKIEAELHRVFDICHGCRRCFNLCDSFPRLFDLIDESETGELDSVDSKDFAPVLEACTFCDMCFMTKCPYVPPHEFDLDFPHLMLRAKAADRRHGHKNFTQEQLALMDRNGKLGSVFAPVANWATDRGNKPIRKALEKTLHIDAEVDLPKFHRPDFTARAQAQPPQVNAQAPAFGRKAVIYSTCFVNYNNPGIGEAALKVLAMNGVETEVDYPACCGMPQLEQGNLEKVAAQAEKVAAHFRPKVDAGLPVIALTASCALMLKFEWPLILPENEDVQALSAATKDIDEYLVDIAKTEGLAPGLKPLDGGIAVHLACHARAQNMGPKAADLMKYIPDTQVDVVERCAGHGGTFGVMKETHEVAMKVGKTTMRTIVRKGSAHVASECPLAAKHLMQGMEEMTEEGARPAGPFHPVELLAKSYGL